MFTRSNPKVVFYPYFSIIGFQNQNPFFFPILIIIPSYFYYTASRNSVRYYTPVRYDGSIGVWNKRNQIKEGRGGNAALWWLLDGAVQNDKGNPYLIGNVYY